MKDAPRSTAKICDRHWEQQRWVDASHSRHWDRCERQRLCCVGNHMFAKAHTETLNGLRFFGGFCAASGFEECKTSPPTKNAGFRSFCCANLTEQYDRRDNIHIFEVEKRNDEVAYERVLEVGDNIGVTIFKQNISVSHPLPSRNPGSRPIPAKFVQRETKFRLMTHKKIEKLIKTIFYQ